MAAEERRGIGGWLGRYRSALARRDLRRLLGAELISLTGSWAYNVALLAWVFGRTHSLGWVGAAGLARFIPQLLASTYGGVIAERNERIRVMVSSDLVNVVWQGGLFVVTLASGPPALALVFAGLTSVSSTVYPPSVAATIPSIVDEDDLAAANALNGTIEQLVVILGPAVGALLLVVVSAPVVFAVNAVSFLTSAVLVARLGVRSRPVDVTEGGTAGPLHQMVVGARTILGLGAARTLVAYCALVSFVYGTDSVLFVTVSARRLGTGTNGFGYLLVALGVGGVLMAGAVDRAAGSPRLGTIILAGALGFALPTALLNAIHSPVLAFVMEVFRGGSTLIVDVLAITALQRAVPGDQLARVFGVFFAFVIGAIALGTILAPIVVGAVGLTAGLWLAALVPAGVALVGYPALRAVDRDTAVRAGELEPKVTLLETLGLFSGATRPILERLAAAAKPVEYEPGTDIVAEGEASDAIYLLTDGQVTVRARGELAPASQVIRVMDAPAYFGEIGVLEGIPRTATVAALGLVRCERIDAEAMLQAFTTAPPSSAMMESARSRLAATHPSRRIAYAPPAAPVEAG